METKEYVYLGYDGTGLFKIGITNDPSRRIKQLRTGNPTFTFLWCFQTENAAIKELEIHTFLSESRFSNEWFDLRPNDLKYFLEQFIKTEEKCGDYFFNLWNEIKNNKQALDKDFMVGSVGYWKSFGKVSK
jgi:hypothetical protein